jgi:hypothetical protein
VICARHPAAYDTWWQARPGSPTSWVPRGGIRVRAHSTSIVTGPSPGVLFGIYRYERESESEFKAWSVDSLSEFARLLLAEWQKRNKAAGNINVVHKLFARAAQNGPNGRRTKSSEIDVAAKGTYRYEQVLTFRPAFGNRIGCAKRSQPAIAGPHHGNWTS